MKLLALFLFSFTVLSCSKTESTQKCHNGNPGLPGKWIEFENYISPGTIWHWETKSNIEIEIKTDFSYSTTNDSYFWGRSGRIENVTDSSFQLVSPVFTSPQTCYYTLKQGVLEIWYPCIEGCGSRFRRK